ncbi:hypothetical protein LCGC14_1123480 [marine sediment metagenome]|uniref:Uncharacterized protein n=1 Tax=marine sediment metagenome TaxID=412755 RepID=A0A0F9PLG6_9ZZZZ
MMTVCFECGNTVEERDVQEISQRVKDAVESGNEICTLCGFAPSGNPLAPARAALDADLIEEVAKRARWNAYEPRRVIVADTAEPVKLFCIDSGVGIAARGTHTVRVTATEDCVPASIRLRTELLEAFELREIRCGVEPLLVWQSEVAGVQNWARSWRNVLLKSTMNFAVSVTNVTDRPMRFEAEVRGYTVAKNAVVAPGTKITPLLGDDDVIDCDFEDQVPGPLSPEGAREAAEKLWEQYAQDRADHFIELAAELQKLWIAKDRAQTFVDAFTLGAAFVAGAVGADDSGNNESYKGIGIVLNCSTFGEDFGKVIVMLAKEHGIDPLPEVATSGKWEGRCAVVLVVDGVGAYDATRLGNAALATFNKPSVEAS